MKPQTYKSRSVEIEALQFDENNISAIVEYCKNDFRQTAEGYELKHISYGWVGLNHGDYVVKIEGGFYRTPADHFESKYYLPGTEWYLNPHDE